MSETAQILLVQGGSHLPRVTFRLLEGAGHEVIAAATGAEGLRLARAQNPDLILLDVTRPDMDGFELCRRIKEDPNLAHCFVVMLGDVTPSSDDQASRLKGRADGYISQPLSDQELLAWVAAILRIKRAEARVAHLSRVLRAINNVNQLIVREKDRDRLLQGSCDVLVAARGYYNVWIALFDQAGRLVTTAEAGVGEAFLPLVKQLKRGELPDCARRALAQAQVAVSEEPPATCTDCPLAASYAGRGAMTVRLERGSKVAGLLCASVPAHYVADEEEQVLLREVAGDIAFALHTIELAEERKGVEAERQAHLRFLESMDRVNRAMQGTNDLEQMMSDVLDVVQAIFGSDRAWLLYPCDPEAPSWQVPVECTRPEYPGAMTLGIEVPMEPEAAELMRTVLNSRGPVRFGPESEHPLAAKDAERFGYRSQISMTLYPKTGKPWMFGLHQCAYPRIWTGEEESLFQEIGWQLTDSLTSLLMFRNLRDSEARYRRIVDTANEGIWVLGEDLSTTFVNARMADMLGYSSEEMLGRPVPDFMFAEDVPDHSKKMENRRQGVSEYYERRLCRKDGKTVWALASATPILDDAQRFQGTFAMLTDITERKQAEEELRASEERYRAVVESAQDAIITVDGNSEIVGWNRGAQNMFGYASTEIMHRSLRQLMPLRHRESHISRMLRIGTGDEPHLIGQVVELHGLRKDGTEFPLELSLAQWEMAQGKFYTGIVRDITKRKRAEEALRQSEEKFHLLFQNAPVGYQSLDENGYILDVNDVWLETLGYSRDEVSGHWFGEFLHPEQRQGYRELFSVNIQSHDVIRGVEFCLLRKNGTEVMVEYTSHIGRDAQGRFARTHCVFQDITERRRAEKALKESEAKYMDLYEKAPDMYASVSAQTALIEKCNHTLANALGYAKEDIIGRPVFEIYHPGCLEEVKKTFELFVETGEVHDQELQLRKKDGSKLDVSLNVSSVRDRDGNILSSRSTLRDITERKRNDAINASRLHLMQFAVTHSLDELLEETLNEAEKLADSLIGFYHFVEEDQESLTLQNWSTRTKADFCQAEGKGLHYAISEAGVWVDCVHQRKPVIHNDYASLPHRQGMPAGHAEVVREMVVPVLRGEKIKAILGVGNKPSDYTAQDVEAVSLLADLAWEIAERKLAEEALHRLNRELQALGNCNQVLLRAIDEQTLLDEICRIVCDEAGYHLAWVGYAEHDDAKTVRPVAWAGFDREYVTNARLSWADDTERGRGAAGQAIRSGEIIYVQDFETDPRMAPWRESALQRGYRSGIALPLKDESGQVFGVLLIYHSKPNAMTPGEVRLMGDLADDLAFGITVLRARVKLQQSRQDLQKSNDLLRAIVEAAPTAIIGLDLDGRVQSVWNPAAEGMLGWSAQEAIGRFLPSVPQDKTEEFRQFREWIRSGQTMNGVEVQRQRRDGTPIDYSIYASPLHGPDGQIAGNVAVLVDITERKRAEEEHEKLQAQLFQAQKMEVLGRLAGGVAHDFNNMLSAILSYTQLALMQCSPSDPIHADLQVIEKSTYRAADLVRQLLAFARKQTVAPKVLDLNDTVAGMLKMLRRLIGEDIHLVWMPGAGVWPIKIDPSQIDQILANLCINARDAIAGVGKVIIQTRNVIFDEAYCTVHAGFVCGEYVMLAVGDDGCGMTQDIVAHLFEPFFTTKEVGKGTGLGLATVYGIVKQNEGFINVYSEPNKGSTFEIYLPRFVGKAVELVAASSAELAKSHGETVLMVEDEAMILGAGQAILKELGYRVLVAGTPSEALRQVEAHAGEIQLLLTDVILPEMNGRDLAELVGKANPGLKVLFMSGYTDDVISHRGVLDQDVHFLQKPFSMQDLASKVREVLKQELTDH